ncbi:putative peroxidase-related enzyme [Methylohalomonas lacus]|uniref:Peroxidase-related enzyme n=1 Tax=Methylohalomonas lacus TaxID=398773 RepID=A0AAE3L0I6_9GAMM|nr:carboxymuconolactone decarboxylase family protein [Methylohalomonas lacus]MCS3902574.1 putative peroxidase-related enzyme [Methylohalomonas lacus]
MTTPYRTSLAPVSPEAAEGDARAALDKAESQVGFVPHMYQAMANSPGLLDTYLHGYQQFRENSVFAPAEQEVVFLVISRENGCHYCMAAHSFLADKQSGVPGVVTDAVRNYETIPDPRLAALARFTAIMVETRGRPTSADAQAFLDAGFSERHILDIVLAQAVKTLSNYTNHLFHTEVDSLFAGRTWNDPHSSAA